jgi:hypothetical protein
MGEVPQRMLQLRVLLACVPPQIAVAAIIAATLQIVKPPKPMSQ